MTSNTASQPGDPDYSTIQTCNRGGRFQYYCPVANQWFNYSRNFGRQNSNQNQPRSSPNQPPSRTNTSSPSAYSPISLNPPTNPPATAASPSLTATNMQSNEQAHQSNQGQKKIPLFFREDYVGFIVKGNFMTLAAKPHLVEEGEWMAHQIVEQNRLLSGMVKCVQTEDRSTGRSICNEQSCPTMSAGPGTNYMWIDTNRNPIPLPASTYIKHIQTWVAGKIQDEALFPTANFQSGPALPDPQKVGKDPNYWLGKTSGFPQRFESEIKNMYKQMFRCYAHLYWQHWLAFWDLAMYRELNTCFMHFVNVGRIFGLLTERDTEPMQPLIDLWVRRGDLPKLTENESAPGATPTSTSAPASASSAALGSAAAAGSTS